MVEVASALALFVMAGHCEIGGGGDHVPAPLKCACDNIRSPSHPPIQQLTHNPSDLLQTVQDFWQPQ